MLPIKRVLLAIMMIASLFEMSKAQDLAVKTDLSSDIFTNINIGGEVGLAPKWTLDLSGEFNAWTFSDNKRWKHWFVQPEARYWFCDRFAGHFVGAHLHGGQYNVGGLDMGFSMLGTDFGKLKDYRFQGWFVGAGVAYGYAWVLGRHWNLEAEIGLGYSYTRYSQFKCAGCGKMLKSNRPHNYFGPTKAAINVVYVF